MFPRKTKMSNKNMQNNKNKKGAKVTKLSSPLFFQYHVSSISDAFKLFRSCFFSVWWLDAPFIRVELPVKNAKPQNNFPSSATISNV